MKKLLLLAAMPFAAHSAFSQCVAPAAPTQVYASPATFCSNTAVTTDLNATTAAAFINWYLVPTGGTPIGNSNSAANFPVTLSTTTTYYAEAVATGGTVSNTYSYTGSVQTFTVPTGVTSVTIEAWGAQGNSNALGVVGGFGGYATGTLPVNPGDVLYINVGGGGSITTNGGFNGGGTGGNAGNPTSFGGGGGGASDVCYAYNTLNDRVIVAAGGGGAGGNRVSGLGRGNGGGGGGGYYGGGGGAAWPNASVVVPTGGTQTSGGSGGTSTYTTLNPTNNGTAGGFGIGGNGGLENNSNQAGSQTATTGGMGGGLVGNNGTYAGNFTGQSGAGGSSYTSPAMTLASTLTGVRSGDGQVIITYIDHCPSPTRTPVTVTINPLPAVSAAASPVQNPCENSTVTLNGGGATSYTWSGPSVIADGVPFTANLAASGTYTVTGTDAAGCSNTTTIVLGVIAAPVLSSSSSTSTTCAGDQVVLNTSGASDYLWSTGDTSTTISVNPTSSTAYIVTGTDSITGCSTSDTLAITVNPLPVLTTTATALTICLGDTATLTVSGADSYMWSTTETSSSIAVSPSTLSSYVVSGSYSATGCTDSDTITIAVNPLPIVVASVANSTICEGDTTAITASGASSYSWLNVGSNATEYVTPTVNTTYYVTGTDAAGCSAQDSVSVSVNALPSVAVSSSASAICEGESATLTASGANSFVWAPSGNTNTTEVVTPAATTTYTVTGTDTLTGCSADATVLLSVNPLPVVTVSLSANSICVDDGPFALTGGSPAGGTWSGTGVSGSTFDAGTAGLGTQQITYTYTNASGCTDSATTAIDVTACTGIVENNGNSSISLFPNPATEQLKITWNSAIAMKSIVITDVSGREVMTVAVNGSNNATISVSELPAGMYSVNTTDANGVNTVTRFIKN